MRTVAQDSDQTMQRVKVGMTGLALVLLLIGLAGIVFNSVSKERPVAAAGAPKADVVANMTIGNDSAALPDGANEPLAELGVAPSTATPGNSTAAVGTALAPPMPAPHQAQPPATH